MPSRYVQLPNGSYLEWPEGVSASDFKAKAQKLMAGQRAVGDLPTGVKVAGRNAAGQPIFAPEDAEKPTYWSALTDPVGSGGRPQGLLGGALQASGQAIKTMAQPLIHPIETAVGMGKVAGDVARGDTFSLGQDVIGPMVQNYARDKANGGNALAVENLGGQLLGAVEGGRLLDAGIKGTATKVGEGATAAREWWRPTSSPDVVPALEQSARKLTNAISPNPAEANQFIDNIQQRMPEILDYAKRTKNPLKTRLEFAKAAQGAGTEVRNWYLKNILGPAEKEEVSVAGTGYRGRASGEAGTQATIGDISNRLEAINKELRPEYRQRNAGMVGSKLATESELTAEANALRSILNRTLARTSGLSEAEVSSIRQMYGSLRNISDATEETVTQRGLQAERAKEGSLPVSKAGFVEKAAKGAMGGQNAISDRAFQKALAEFNEQRPSSFHQVADRFAKSSRPTSQAAARTPLRAPGPSEPPSAGTISQAEQQQFLDKVQERLAGRKAAIAQKAQRRIEAAAAEEARNAIEKAATQREKDLIRFNSQFQ
jgi:hypothetical protein